VNAIQNIQTDRDDTREWFIGHALRSRTWEFLTRPNRKLWSCDEGTSC